MPRQKSDEDRRGSTFFIRVSPKERAIVEAAIKLKHGEVEGSISKFARRALLLYARQIIRDAQQGKSLP